MDTIKECFDVILRGNKSASRLAARRVRKLLYGSRVGRDKYEDIGNLINNAPGEYAKIPEEWRQENFVVAVSVIYYLHDREKQPDFLFPWLFQLLQHSNGVIRYAAVRMLSNEIGPLTYHIRCPGEKSTFGDRLKPEEADTILYSLFVSLNELLAALWQPKYKRYKYIDSLPASPYKSAQMVLAELKESCGEEYVERLEERCCLLPGDSTKVKKEGKVGEGEFSAETVGKFDDDDFFDDCPICQLMKKMQREGRQPKTSELKLVFDEAKKKGAVVGGDLVEENGLECIGNAEDFQMPKWMECTWRRIKCGRDGCPICGRVKRDRERHIARGEDPDSMGAVLEDVEGSLHETLEMIQKHAEEMGIDIENIDNIQEPPKPKEFPLYLEVKSWRGAIFAMLERAEERLGEEFVLSEAAQDLAWYTDLLPAKVYRQLCNRWHIENGDDYGESDHQYTSYVISECLKIIKSSIGELSSFALEKGEPLLVPIQPEDLEEKILNI